MANCRKIAVKRLNLETYDDMIKHLMKLFLSLARNAGEIHLIFDNYFDDSFKTFERIRRSKAKGKKKVEALPVIILSGEQRLPASMDSFWPLSGNKLQLQRFTIDWISKNYTGNKPIYLGGAHKENTSNCVVVQDNITIIIPELQCYHEEADDRILLVQ